ncbi:hypothetical protein ElyMa_006623900 [Elysia marginata]|uniref:Uncharacterized protein n=1 Tax=Elysia marginata TaxID=1093978 RepID=A0AAV4IK12_9GAST|nr:hypothetical protein ElyMa_006623900 [Elysia marginata]
MLALEWLLVLGISSLFEQQFCSQDWYPHKKLESSTDADRPQGPPLQTLRSHEQHRPLTVGGSTRDCEMQAREDKSNEPTPSTRIVQACAYVVEQEVFCNNSNNNSSNSSNNSINNSSNNSNNNSNSNNNNSSNSSNSSNNNSSNNNSNSNKTTALTITTTATTVTTVTTATTATLVTTVTTTAARAVTEVTAAVRFHHQGPASQKHVSR